MEKFDIYDDNRILTGKVKIKGEKCDMGENKLVVHICIFNSQGQLLIQHRQHNKKLYPDLWDLSVGGHTMAGESSRQSAERELKEELGIKYDFSNIRPSLTINFTHGFDDYYILKLDLDADKLTLQDEEVESVKWASLDEIIHLVNSKQFIPYTPHFIKLLFDMKNLDGVLYL